jgi:hypothetical protein
MEAVRLEKEQHAEKVCAISLVHSVVRVEHPLANMSCISLAFSPFVHTTFVFRQGGASILTEPPTQFMAQDACLAWRPLEQLCPPYESAPSMSMVF